MPLLGMGGETEKASPCRFCRGGMRLPSTTFLRRVISTVVPTVGRLFNDLVRDAREPEKVALLQKVWRQRLSYRPCVAQKRAKSPFQACGNPRLTAVYQR